MLIKEGIKKNFKNLIRRNLLKQRNYPETKEKNCYSYASLNVKSKIKRQYKLLKIKVN